MNPGALPVRVKGSAKRLLLGGLPREVLWEIVDERDVVGLLVWPRRGIYGSLPGTTSVATGKVLPRDVTGGVAVKTRLVPIRNGMSVHPGPEGFRLETLIVANEDDTWSPAPVWVGEKFDLA